MQSDFRTRCRVRYLMHDADQALRIEPQHGGFVKIRTPDVIFFFIGQCPIAIGSDIVSVECDRGAEIGRRPASFAAGIGLRARIDMLSARPGNDRGRSGGRDCDRFQSRFLAHAEHADDSLARLHANENVASASDCRIDN